MLIRTLTTADQVIDALGGNTPVSKLTGRGLSAISNWRKKNRIAKTTYLIMLPALRRRRCRASPAIWSLPESVASLR